MQHIHPLVIGNWKMNPVTVTDAKTIITSLKSATKKYPDVTIVVAPPSLFLLDVKKLLGSSAISLCAQTMHESPAGAQTGELSAGMLTAAGATYVILGHSERRALNETDEQINRKIIVALKAKLTPVICLGEKERDPAGNFYSQIEQQISRALHTVLASRLREVVIAYEPIWAIGTGKTASVEDVCEMQLFIKKILTKQYGKASAAKVRIIYGGSVNAENARGLFQAGGVTGFLVGGVSLKPAEFIKIIAATL